jgi:DNA-binding GntR family transcriptional regulator
MTFSASERQIVEKTSFVLLRTIRAAILDGRLAPDQPLREVELAEQLGTSRTPIREALLLLEREGLVEAPPNRGATVKRYDLVDLEEIYDLRSVLEGHAASLAAHRITDAQLCELERSCDRFTRLRASDDSLRRLADENFTFHGIILEAAGSERLARTIQEMTALPVVYQSYMNYSSQQRGIVEREHRRIADALKRRDAAEAAELMRAHVVWAGDIAMAKCPRLD